MQNNLSALRETLFDIGKPAETVITIQNAEANIIALALSVCTYDLDSKI